MKQKQQAKQVARRDLLKLASLGGVAAGAAAMTASRDAEAATDPSKNSSGYRETAHVRKYYELAKF